MVLQAVLNTHNTELLTLKMHDVHIIQHLCAATTGCEKLVEFSVIFGFPSKLLENLATPQIS
jgi:hypothetical protein